MKNPNKKKPTDLVLLESGENFKGISQWNIYNRLFLAKIVNR